MYQMLHSTVISRKNLDEIFTALADEYVKAGGKEAFNIYVVGGAAIVINFDYRLSTMDIDAFFVKNDCLTTAIANVANNLKLPQDWLNKDFVSTPSYTDNLVAHSKLYRSYNGVINVYVLETKYIIAMKLKSSRPTGGDLDDIIKMIHELRLKGEDIAYDQIIEAYKELYSDFSNTYDYFLEKTKEACDMPIEELKELYNYDI